jgi:antibiotic biosynthesis monooxygenase (ABM) superfamily enzyme
LAVVSWLGIFPLVAMFVALAEIALPPFTHRLVSLGLVTIMVVLAMTYVVGPALTRILRGWLHRRI